MVKARTRYFYILRCRAGTLYSGIAVDLLQREKMHNSGKGSAYVRSRGGGRVVHWERFLSVGKALRREAAVKRLSRTQKLAIITKGADKIRSKKTRFLAGKNRVK